MLKNRLKLILKAFVLVAVTLGFTSPPKDKGQYRKQQQFSFGIWGNVDKNKTDMELLDFFKRFRDAGITDYYMGNGAQELARIISITKDMDINIHGWVWTLNRPGDKIAAEHPDWYAVNRNGDNSFEFRPYVDYYQWLSPFSEGAREHIKNSITDIAQVEGLASVHLDYVRFCDVILGLELQPKYNLIQDREMPEFDFGYHPDGRKKFKEIFGRDPLDMEHPELSNEWRQFRLNAVTSLVNELADIAHQHNRKISAAVFPFPEMSRMMVRQDWSSWDIDIFCPMNYHSFYLEDLNWIGFSVENGIRELRGRNHSYISGLYIPALSPEELGEAIHQSRDAGANGISMFSAGSLKDEHLDVVRSLNRKFNTEY